MSILNQVLIEESFDLRFGIRINVVNELSITLEHLLGVVDFLGEQRGRINFSDFRLANAMASSIFIRKMTLILSRILQIGIDHLHANKLAITEDMSAAVVHCSSILELGELWDGVIFNWGGNPQLLTFIHSNISHMTREQCGRFVNSFLEAGRDVNIR